MSSHPSAERADHSGTTTLDRIAIALGAVMVLVDVAVVYALLATAAVPAVVTYGGTVLVAVVVGGSFLFVLGSRRFGSNTAPDGDPSTAVRAARATVSVAVVTGASAILGYGGGLVLAVGAWLGGPDPRTTDGDLLRDRLLDWPDRNREFMRQNGRGELPLLP